MEHHGVTDLLIFKTVNSRTCTRLKAFQLVISRPDRSASVKLGLQRREADIATADLLGEVTRKVSLNIPYAKEVMFPPVGPLSQGAQRE